MMFYEPWEPFLIPTLGFVSIFVFFYLEKYVDKSIEDWLHTNKKMMQKILYFVGYFGTLISAVFGFLSYCLSVWIGWGGFRVFDIPPFFEFQFIVLMLTLIWSRVRQDYTNELFDQVVNELPYILEDEQRIMITKNIIKKFKGESENLTALIEKVESELKVVNQELQTSTKSLKELEDKRKKQQEEIMSIHAQIKENKKQIELFKLDEADLQGILKEKGKMNKELESALQKAKVEFLEIQNMIRDTNKITTEFNKNLIIEEANITEALQKIDDRYNEEKKKFDKLYAPASNNEEKLKRYLLDTQKLEKKNEYLQNLLNEQFKIFPLVSRPDYEWRVKEFARKTLMDYLPCPTCQQQRMDCTCGASRPMFS